MASLSSPNHCCSSSSPYFAYSSVGFHQFQKTIRFPLISLRNFGSNDVSLRSKSTALTDVVVMQDGALAAKLVNANEAPPKKVEGLSTVNHSVEEDTRIAFDGKGDKSTVSITVVGASGDLAKKKIFPALFALYYEDCLPEHFTIFGYARSKMSDAELRNMVSRTLTCRIDKRENCGEKMEEFLKRCFYHSGQYDSEENFTELNAKLKEHEIKQDLVEDVATCSSSF